MEEAIEMLTRGKRRRSVTRSVRIDEDVAEMLEDLSKEERVSVNVLVNDALRKYVEWDVRARKFGMLDLAHVAAKRLFDYLEDDEVEEYANWIAKNVFKELVVFWFKKSDLVSVLKAIRLLGAVGQYQYEEELGDDSSTFICKHNRGPKWSLYYYRLFKSVFEDLHGSNVTVEQTDDQVMVRFTTTNKVFLQSLLEELRRR